MTYGEGSLACFEKGMLGLTGNSKKEAESVVTRFHKYF
jgi:hypothetical protein